MQAFVLGASRPVPALHCTGGRGAVRWAGARRASRADPINDCHCEVLPQGGRQTPPGGRCPPAARVRCATSWQWSRDGQTDGPKASALSEIKVVKQADRLGMLGHQGRARPPPPRVSRGPRRRTLPLCSLEGGRERAVAKKIRDKPPLALHSTICMLRTPTACPEPLAGRSRPPPPLPPPGRTLVVSIYCGTALRKTRPGSWLVSWR